MNPKWVESFMALLILAYVFMGLVFIAHQKQGKSFVASFDKAFIWGVWLFAIGNGINAVTYVAMA
jgi:hypothetical protein